MAGLHLLRSLILLGGLLALIPAGAQAREIEGVKLAESIEQAGQDLQLNGAGVRSKFFFDIYVGALYLPVRQRQADRIFSQPAPARVAMHILYPEVAAKRLVHGWQAGFEKNQDKTRMQGLQARLQAFNAMFGDLHRGDVLLFELLGDGSTRVVINDKERGCLPGVDFQRALLAVWLGDDPADAGLKEAMLGSD